MLPRRAFLGALAVAPALASSQTTSPAGRTAKQAGFRPRAHFLEGVARENLKITDIKVTIMSYELPKTGMAGRNASLEDRAVLVEVFTDKGIVGIGEASPYGGPESQ